MSRREVVKNPIQKKSSRPSFQNHAALNQAIFQYSSDGIHILDSEGYVIEANDNFCKMLGYSKDEIIGMHVTDWDAEIDKDVLINEIIPNFFTDLQKSILETQHRCKDGSLIPVEITTSPMLVGDEKFLYCSARDISARRKQRDEAAEQLSFSQSVIENSPSGIILFDIAGSCIMANKAIGRMVNSSKEQVMNLNFKEIQSWRDSGLLNIANRVIKDKVKISGEVTINTSNGLQLFLSYTFDVIYIGSRELLVTHFNDMSEKMNSLIELEESRATQQMIFDYSPLPFLFFDGNGIIDCNLAAVKILGCENKAHVLKHHPAFFSPEFQPDGMSSAEKSQQMDRIAHELGRHVFEWKHRRIDGVEFLVEVTLVPLNLNGRPVLLVLWRDLTAIRESELRLIESSKMAALGEMSAGIAHEINNPLAVIMGKVALLKHRLVADTIDPEKMKEDLHKIQNMSDRISKIIRGLRSFSRSAEQDPMIPAKVSQIIQETIELCRERFISHQVDLRVKVKTEVSIECRQTQISQVLMNLLSNAFDAVEVLNERWVSIDVTDNGVNAKICVADSGKGISPEIVKKIMQPFFTTKPVGKGTGLGLSISKGILEKHSGSINYDFNSSNTCFIIELPINQTILPSSN